MRPSRDASPHSKGVRQAMACRAPASSPAPSPACVRAWPNERASPGTCFTDPGIHCQPAEQDTEPDGTRRFHRGAACRLEGWQTGPRHSAQQRYPAPPHSAHALAMPPAADEARFGLPWRETGRGQAHPVSIKRPAMEPRRLSWISRAVVIPRTAHVRPDRRSSLRRRPRPADRVRPPAPSACARGHR